MGIKVKIFMKESSQPIEFLNGNVENTYQKGDLFCVYLKDENKVYKYPIANIFSVVEDYGKHNQAKAQTEVLNYPGLPKMVVFKDPSYAAKVA